MARASSDKLGPMPTRYAVARARGQRDCFVLPVCQGRGRAAPRRAWQPEPSQRRALEPCRNRHGRVGAVAEYMLAALGVPATGLSRSKGIVAWTEPGGY